MKPTWIQRVNIFNGFNLEFFLNTFPLFIMDITYVIYPHPNCFPGDFLFLVPNQKQKKLYVCILLTFLVCHQGNKLTFG